MRLSEKIAALRKANRMTQEELAEKCHVSRQSVSKWEADAALPETEKLLLLGDLFHVSMDALLRDEWTLNEVQKTQSCGQNAVQEKKRELHEGVLIKESVADDAVIDLLNVHRLELWDTGGKPKYWTALFFTSDAPDLPERMARVMNADSGSGGKWFVDFQTDRVKYIVLKDRILKYRIGNRAEKALVCAECRKMGIPDGEMNWPE